MVNRNRRPFEWYSVRADWGALTTGAQTNLLMYNAIVHGPRNLKGATVTRIIGDIKIRSETVAQDNTGIFGIVVVNADARAAAAFPDADDYTDRVDWLYLGRLQNKQSDLSDASQWTTMNLDLRAQRILRSEEDELHLVVDSISAFTFEWTANLRTLVKLP